MKKLLVTAGLATLLVFPLTLYGYTITFDNLVGVNNVLYHGSTEGGFTITPVTLGGDDEWREVLGGLSDGAGNPVPAIYFGPFCDPGGCGAGVGNVDITMGGGTFSFVALDYLNDTFGISSYHIQGFLGSSMVYDLSGNLEPGGFQTLSGSNSALVDRLEIQFQTFHQTEVIDLDNIIVNPNGVADSPLGLTFVATIFAGLIFVGTRLTHNNFRLRHEASSR